MNKIFVVGIGPGEQNQMTLEAMDAIKECNVIVGYTVYVDLIKEYYPEKKFITTPMKKEIDRCKICFEEAKKGNCVAMICSGDAGVYGMSGLILEIGKEEKDVDIEIIPGITAAISGASVLGAPLIHDFTVISLSDLLTPWEKIEKRLKCAAMGDFVICLYNPSSKKRHDYLKKACEIILEYASKETVCGIVENIGRDGENSQICTLDELKQLEVNMFTTVFIGNSQTKVCNGKMVTPRGYQV